MDHPLAPQLSSAGRKALRGQAMNLKPAVMIGRAGVTPTVLEAVNAALQRDGLIKVRIEAPDKAARQSWLAQVAESTRSTICGEVGHTASLFRPKPASPAPRP